MIKECIALLTFASPSPHVEESKFNMQSIVNGPSNEVGLYENGETKIWVTIHKEANIELLKQNQLCNY